MLSETDGCTVQCRLGSKNPPHARGASLLTQEKSRKSIFQHLIQPIMEMCGVQFAVKNISLKYISSR